MAGSTAHNAALGSNITVTLSCSDGSVRAQQFLSDMTDITITPKPIYSSKHGIGVDLPHRQMTMINYDVSVTGEMVGNIISFQAAAKASAASRGSRDTPTYTMGIDCDAGANGAWSLTLKRGTYSGGPMTIGGQNVPLTQKWDAEFQELDVSGG